MNELLNQIVALYCDGGVIKKNPSDIGGTWAWCGVNAAGVRIIEKSGAFPAPDSRTVSNNHTEQIAITLALEAMPSGWSGIVYSDSNCALGRVFKGWAEKNLPKNISERSKKARLRLGQIKTVLLQGHPTKEDLKNGIGKKRNLPVSEHNVWCDKACGKAAEEFLAKIVEKKTVETAADENTFDPNLAVGMEIKAAAGWFAGFGYQMRITQKNGDNCIVTRDYVSNRINVAVIQDKVSSVLSLG